MRSADSKAVPNENRAGSLVLVCGVNNDRGKGEGWYLRLTGYDGDIRKQDMPDNRTIKDCNP